MKYFKGKVAAITGAGSGIGRALAVALAKDGCELALSDVDKKGLAETAEILKHSGVKVSCEVVDVADRQSMHDWAEAVFKDHGRVNYIFNNAGVALGGTVAETDYQDFEWIIGINMWGVIHGTKAFLPLIKRSAGKGHVVNVSSVFGLFSQPTQSGYNLSKFAVRGFTESLRQELDLDKSGISATCVHPGGIKTNIAKNARMTDSMTTLTGEATADNMKDRFEALFLTTPEKAANAILKAVKANRRRVLVGPDAILLDFMQRTLPTQYQKIVTSAFQFAAR